MLDFLTLFVYFVKFFCMEKVIDINQNVVERETICQKCFSFGLIIVLELVLELS